MKPLPSMLIGILIGAVAVTALAAAQSRFEPFQLRNQRYVLDKMSDESRIRYLEGVVDAIAYIRPEDAIGDAVSRCIVEEEVVYKTGILFERPVRRAAEKAGPDTPIVALLLEFFRDGCAAHWK